MKSSHHFIGELLGTFILVLVGCGAVAVTVLFSAHMGLFQVAAVFGSGVALAIYATRHLSCAHLNPAVSVAMVLAGRMAPRRLPLYFAAQLLGAFLAAGVLYLVFADSIAHFEAGHHLVRGSLASARTAMIFGEFYPPPGAGNAAAVSTGAAVLAEGIGTFALAFLILSLTDGCNLGRPDASISPLVIGLAVTVIISVLAPLTQAGLNPARDLGPRLFAAGAGWGRAAFQERAYASLLVYVAAPLAGGALAGVLVRRVMTPLLKGQRDDGCT